MATTENFHAQPAIRQRVPLLSGFFTPSPTHKHGPDTAKRYEDLEKETEFIISQGQAADLTPNPNASSQPPRHQRVNSTSRLNIFNKVFTSPSPPSPPVETTSVTILLLPQSGTRPLLLTLRTIDIRLEGHKDNHLSHIPDMRSFWGDGEAWHARIQKYARLSLSKVEDPEDSENLRLAGTYMLLYTPEGNGLPLNQRWDKGVSGDACVVKLGRDGNVWGKGGAAAYEDVEREFLDSGLYRKMLMGMFDSPEKEGSKGHNKNDLGKETS